MLISIQFTLFNLSQEWKGSINDIRMCPLPPQAWSHFKDQSVEKLACEQFVKMSKLSQFQHPLFPVFDHIIHNKFPWFKLSVNVTFTGWGVNPICKWNYWQYVNTHTETKCKIRKTVKAFVISTSRVFDHFVASWGKFLNQMKLDPLHTKKTTKGF